jgi:hypothetical protein
VPGVADTVQLINERFEFIDFHAVLNVQKTLLLIIAFAFHVEGASLNLKPTRETSMAPLRFSTVG